MSEPKKIPNCPRCGGESEWIKLWDAKRYDGFIRCTECGHEGRCYTSKQNAVKAWLRERGVVNERRN